MWEKIVKFFKGLATTKQPVQPAMVEPTYTAPPPIKLITTPHIVLGERSWKVPTREVHSVFIHCSASDNPAHNDVSVIRDWHLARGFAGTGYHFFIKADGTVQDGRSLAQIPAAQAGHNTGSIAICLHGLTVFTDAQFDTLRSLCKAIQAAYTAPLKFRGHCEVAPKTCPVFDYRKVLGLNKKGHIQN